jgi:hypothetical protein
MARLSNFKGLAWREIQARNATLLWGYFLGSKRLGRVQAAALAAFNVEVAAILVV